MPRNIDIKKLTNKPWKAVPGKLQVSRGEKINFKAHNDTEAILIFPDKGVFGTNLAIVPKNGTTQIQLSANAPTGQHDYAIFCVKDGKFAQSGSYPTIIIT